MVNHYFKTYVCFVFLFSAILSKLSAQTLDPNFKPNIKQPGYINAIVEQADKKIIVGGNIDFVGDSLRSNLVRLHSDGSLDPLFIPDIKIEYLSALALQTNEQVLVAGRFTRKDGTPLSGVVRLNNDGKIDNSFSCTINDELSSITTITVDNNDKILIGGSFNQVNKTSRNSLARLNQDGSLDQTFANPIFTVNQFYSIVLQNDNKILLAGSFTMPDGSQKICLQLNADGTLDNNFIPNLPTLIVGTAHSIGIQPDNKIIIGGNLFFDGGKQLEYGVIRLNSDGTRDNSFNTNTIFDKSLTGTSISVAIQNDGKILLMGYYGEYDYDTGNQTAHHGLTRLHSDGTLDDTFERGNGKNELGYITNTLLLLDNQQILLANSLSSYNGVPINSLIRVNSNGSVDTQFNAKISQISSFRTITAQQDGKILVNGNFNFINGSSSVPQNLSRLNQNGSLDESFKIDTTIKFVGRVAVQKDQKILIELGEPPYLKRLNSDGSYDNSFNFTEWIGGTFTFITVQSDGKILIGGSIQNNAVGKGIFRLMPDGSLDETFNTGTGTGWLPVFTSALQENGKILIAGSFTTFNGVKVNGLARLNTDGSLDNSFYIDSTETTSTFVQSIAIQDDGKILIGGSFTSFNNVPVNNLVRLNADGTLDPSFHTGIGPDLSVNAIATHADGKILIGGYFTSFNGVDSNHMAVLHEDGSLFTPLNVGNKNNGFVSHIATQPDGNYLIAGRFLRVENEVRYGLAKLVFPPAAPTQLIAEATSASQINLKWIDKASNESSFEIQRSATALTGFTTITTTAANITSYNDVNLNPATTYYYRIRAINAADSSTFSSEVSAQTLKADQSITFTALPDKVLGTTPFSLTASASSTLPVTFTVVSGTATISGDLLTLTGAGKVTIKASQTGNDAYNAALPVEQTFCVLPAKPTITQAGTSTSAIFTLTSSSTTGNQWLKNGEEIAGATSQSYNVTQAGNYSVRVIINGCRNIEDASTVSLTGEEASMFANQIKLYPNPAAERIMIEVTAEHAKQIKVTLYNLLGVKLSEHNLTNKAQTWQHEFDIRNYPRGSYVVIINDGNKQIMQSFIKQ